MDNTQDTLTKYGTSFQAKIISALLTDAKFLGELDGILLSKFFESDTNKWIVDSIIDYYDIFKTSPTLDVFKVKVSKLESEVLSTVIIAQLKHIYTEIDTVDVDYVKSEFKSFCINQNLKEVILQSVDLLKLGNYDKIKDLVDDAMKVGAENNLGLNYITDYVLRMTEANRKTVETPWDVITDLMDGGLSGGELAVVVAPSGVGKCVGGDTEIDIEYDEIGFELKNGFVIWCKPWDKIQLGYDVELTASEARKLIELSGV